MDCACCLATPAPHTLHLLYTIARILLHFHTKASVNYVSYGILCSSCIYILYVLTCEVSSPANDTKVYFSFIVSGGENGFSSLGGIPSIDLALEGVEKKGLLPGYNLTYDNISDSKVNMLYVSK